MGRPVIDPAFGIDLTPTRTLKQVAGKVSVIIPAHNEQATVAEVVTDVRRGLNLLAVDGDIVVSASGCTDDTADVAEKAGARVVVAAIGKGVAIRAGIAATDGEIVCLIDGDIRYFGDRPLVTILVEPILKGMVDACVTDLYWRPLYPQMWLNGFFAPVAGWLFPEMLSKVGSTPWSGQRAAVRELWPTTLPDDFTVDLEILMHWNQHARRLRPVVADDWINPQRPKHDLMAQELEVLMRHAVTQGRIGVEMLPAFRGWYDAIHSLMARYRSEEDNPQKFERRLLLDSLQELRSRVANLSAP